MDNWANRQPVSMLTDVSIATVPILEWGDTIDAHVQLMASHDWRVWRARFGIQVCWCVELVSTWRSGVVCCRWSWRSTYWSDCTESNKRSESCRPRHRSMNRHTGTRQVGASMMSTQMSLISSMIDCWLAWQRALEIIRTCRHDGVRRVVDGSIQSALQWFNQRDGCVQVGAVGDCGLIVHYYEHILL